jgi:predicted translin family RNA/ssDNA-binding protein
MALKANKEAILLDRELRKKSEKAVRALKKLDKEKLKKKQEEMVKASSGRRQYAGGLFS